MNSYLQPTHEVPSSLTVEYKSVETLSADIGNMRALVPGCGSGYDCLLLKELGFKEVVGKYESIYFISSNVSFMRQSKAFIVLERFSKLLIPWHIYH